MCVGGSMCVWGGSLCMRIVVVLVDTPLKDGVDVLQNSLAVVENVLNETLEGNQLHLRCLQHMEGVTLLSLFLP